MCVSSYGNEMNTSGNINIKKDLDEDICGKNVYIFRKKMNISQRMLADLLQLDGLDVDKNAVQRIECGKRFVTDIELVHLANVLKRTVAELLCE